MFAFPGKPGPLARKGEITLAGPSLGGDQAAVPDVQYSHYAASADLAKVQNPPRTAAHPA
jgi:hypothetical protein